MFDKAKKLWEEWDLRFLILISLSVQVFLVFFATSRKRSASTWVITPIWSAYLLADWITPFTVGLISKSQANICTDDKAGDLLALWAPFLLLHLGGPDTITSFSSQDNELWLRHLLGLILQVGAAGYVLLQSFPKNKLWVPTILVLIAGIIKYAERIYAQFLSSLDRFGDTERVMKTITGLDNEVEATEFKDEQDLTALGHKSLLCHAFEFFEKTLTDILAGRLISFHDRQVTRNFFLERTGKDAFKLIEVELSLVYEVLHTKVVVVRCWAGYILRSISFVSILSGCLLFSFSGKQKFHSFDIGLTFALFIGALVLDFISAYKLVFFDRTVVAIENSWGEFIASKIINRRRWSESVDCCSFVSYCLKDFPKWIEYPAQLLSAGALLDKVKLLLLVSPRQVNEDVKHSIFKHLRGKSLVADSPKAIENICSSRGDRAIWSNSGGQLIWTLSEFVYTESLLMWHIATEVYYHASSDSEELKEFSKLLSDYALYLLLRKPGMVASVSGDWKMVFQDTCEEAKTAFHENSCLKHMKACEKILFLGASNQGFEPGAVKEEFSKSVFTEACVLASQLVEEGCSWELISEVWLEMLCYATVNCRANVHIQQVSKGGELISIIWLLMNHFGLGNQFYEARIDGMKFLE